jgi:hypothetical protein
MMMFLPSGKVSETLKDMGGFLALVFDDFGTVCAVNEVFTREFGG